MTQYVRLDQATYRNKKKKNKREKSDELINHRKKKISLKK